MLSNKKAQQLIDSGLVEIDGTVISENCMLPDNAEIKVEGVVEQARKTFVYIIFYKPVGFESTLNKNIEQNLSPFFTGFEGLAIAGRLDKQSEGLLLLSNDGKWVENICNPKFEKEKEYFVTLNKAPGDLFATAFKNGINIGTYHTKPCQCRIVDELTIHVILTEGKNRQIRRMCKALGYEVTRLKRVRVDSAKLGNLQPGEFTLQ